MSDGSPIGWLHQPGYKPCTPNIVLGCKRRSAGCDLCYAPHWVARQQHLPGRDGIVAKDAAGRLGWTGKVVMFPDRIDAIAKRKAPHMMFVTALGELFDPQVTDEFLRHLWRTMQACPQHIFVILTKLPKRMHDKVTQLAAEFGVLPNVWLGTSVEDQDQANIRLPWLLRTPAAIRAASFEPLLGPVDPTRLDVGGDRWINAFTGEAGDAHGTFEAFSAASLDWAIIGGETGPKADARPMHPRWARLIVNRARHAKVATFFKQWGSWGPAPWVVRVPDDVIGDPEKLAAAKKLSERIGATHAYPEWAHLYEWSAYEPPHKPWSSERKELPADEPHAPIRYYPGKTAGHLLDGQVIHEWPSVGGRIITAPQQDPVHA